MIKIKKGIPLYDQCDENGFWGKIFGSSFVPETLFQPLEDLSIAFEKLCSGERALSSLHHFSGSTKKTSNAITFGLKIEILSKKSTHTFLGSGHCPYSSSVGSSIAARIILLS